MTDRWKATGSAVGERIDRHLAERYDEARNQVRRWFDDGRVLVDGAVVRASHRLRSGETIACDPPPPPGETRIEPETGALEVVYEDEHLVAVDKPAGLVVHPGAGRSTGTLVHRLLAHYPEMAGVGGPGRPGIVHRLDKDTTGLLLAARNARTHRRLAAAFAERRVEKRYLALAWGRLEPASRVVDQPVGRHPTRRREMAVRPGGRPAHTELRLLADAGPVSLLDVLLGTGRTHQIRVHLKWAGHPLVGDPVYGEDRWKGIHGRERQLLASFPRPALHAWKLSLDHPDTGEPLTLAARVPRDLRALWRELSGRDLDTA